MQTPREVINSLVRKQPADRVGLMDSPWHDTLRKWVDQGYPTNDEDDPVGAAEHFGFDMVGCGGWFPWVAKVGEDELLEETEEWTVRRNGSGAALKYWKHKSGTPEHIDFLMTDRQVWERDYRPHVVGTARERVEAQLEGTKKAVEAQGAGDKWSHYGHMFLWEMMRASLGDLTLYESMIADPAWIHDYCRVYTDLFKEGFSILLEECGKPDGMWIYEDLGYRDRTFCAPETYAELIFPYYAEVVELFHSHDLPVVLHTCGFTEPVLDLIVDAGFDGLHPMEAKAGNRPLWIAENYGDKLCLIGGLDVRILESGDKELIRREVTSLVEGMKQRGASYVYASDHSISTNVDYEDFKFAVEVYRECTHY